MNKKITPALSALLAFALGAFWYSSYAFGPLWQSSLRHSIRDEDMLLASIACFACLNIMAYGMQWLIQKVKIRGLFEGFSFGLFISLIFVATSLSIIYIYTGDPRSTTLWAIHTGYFTALLSLIAMILAGL